MSHKKCYEDVWCNFIKEEISNGGIVPLEISTDSMMPLIRPMDKIMVKGCDIRDIRLGDIVAFNIDSQLYVHRLLMKKYKDGEALFVAKGDRAFALDSPFTSEQFLGKIIKLKRNSKVLNLEKQPWVIVNKFLYVLSWLKFKSAQIIRILKY